MKTKKYYLGKCNACGVTNHLMTTEYQKRDFISYHTDQEEQEMAEIITLVPLQYEKTKKS